DIEAALRREVPALLSQLPRVNTVDGMKHKVAVESSIGRVKAAFDALPDSIRGKFSPEVRAAILGAADLGFSLEAVGTKGEKAIERVLAQLGRLRGRLAASAEAGGIAGNLEQTLPRARATPAVNLRTIASGINDAVAQLDSLAAPLRRRVAPAFKETIERAIELARTIESSGRSNVTDINSVASAVKRLSAELRAAKADAELSNSGLFGNAGGSRGVDSLNQEVRSLSDAFRLLPANSRAALVPFVTQVKEARARLREGTGGVRDYQAAVSSLAAALKSIQSTSAAFTGDSTAAGRAKAVEQLETRINAASQASESFGRAGTRSLQEVANAAKVAAAGFAAGVGPLSAAERAVALLEARVQELQRSEGVSKLFRVGAEPTKLEQFGGLVGKLDERFNALGLDSRRALKGLGEGLRQAYAAALDSGRATASLTQAYEALLNAVLEVEGAEETRRARNAVASARFLTVLPDAGDEAAARQAAARRLIGTEARGPTELPRSLEALGGKIASIRSELESLPKPLQKSLLPILRSLSAEFVTVAGSVKPSKKELQSLIQQAAILEKLLSGSRSQDQTRRNQVAGRQDIAFSLTGRAQNLDQAKTDLNRLIGLIQDLDAAKRKAFAPTLRTISDLIATGDKAKLKDIVSLLRTLDADLNKERRLEINSKDAKKRLDDIRAALASVSSTLTGKTADPFAALDQSAARAKQAVDRLADSKRKTTLQGRITAIESQNAQDVIAARNQTLTPGELARRARGRSRSLDAIAGSAEKQVVTDVFGPAVGSSAQKVDALKSRISSLQASIAALPRPIQSALVPELNKARDAFFNLSKTPTKAEINQILKLVNGLELSFKRAAAAAKFGESFASFLRGSAEERYTSKLQAIRQAMAAIGITAKGPVASAINDYGTALAAASSKGKLATQATAAAMDKLLQKIADAAVASGKLSKAQAAAFVANVKNAGVGRSGDVSRLGVDKFTLGLQQAGFALDDFFSATGGIDQKIRAISNNISQLGFIVGGTEGLFLALGVTIGAQVALGIQKFVNGGRTAADQTNALNEALARQKSLIEELGQAFESFATALSKGTFSRQAAEARDFEKQIREIAKKQKEQRESRLIDLSPEVQRERAEQKRIDRELEGATDAGQRVALIAQREASKKREEAAAKAAVAVPLPAKEQVLDTVQRTIRANEFLVGGKLTAFSERAAQARREKAAADVAEADTVDKQAAVVRERLAERRDVAAKPIGVFNFEQNAEIIRAREDVAALETLLASLEEQIKANGNALAVSILEASIPIAKSLEQTQKLLDEAIFPFSETRKQADKIAKELESVVTELKTASDPNRIQELEQQQQALRSQAAATNAAAQALRSFADVVNRISTSL
ncbi:MAG: hypothetical protein EBZ49_07410, partial [Proteobacteria bacterium]|nr:hypothetical protein [Pseudomonadota bacterium]